MSTLELALIILLCIIGTIIVLRNILLIGSFLLLVGAVLLFIITAPLILLKKIIRAIKGADFSWKQS